MYLHALIKKVTEVITSYFPDASMNNLTKIIKKHRYEEPGINLEKALIELKIL